MKFKFLLFFMSLLIADLVFSQITTSPALPLATQSVTITFDSSKESRLGYFTGELYAHTGVKVEGQSDWQHVISNWGDNTKQPKLTNKGNGIYELIITPDINTFYSVLSSEKVVQLAFVFRSADGNKQTNDLFVDVLGLHVEITKPAKRSYVNPNQAISISAKASLDASIKIYSNNTLITQSIGKELNTSYSFPFGGTFWIIAEASTNTTSDRDSVLVFVSDNVVTKAKPEAYKPGINYPNNNSAALVLWAPLKDSVYVIGDFNDWTPSKTFKMNKDHHYFWIDIPNLEPGKEYAYQYFIDGELKIADPYAEKILDPLNDKYIGSTPYPNLMAYPIDKTTGMVSILQPGQEKYNWEMSDFQIPDKEKLVIYELLVRDFTEEHTYKAVYEKLDYLEDLNINVLELMPVNEFEKNSSWGYNPTFYFAPDKYYGPKNELKKLIDECHKRGIAVVLDMVLNHSYGLSPFVQMYKDNWSITDENPWYNKKHSFKNPDAQWGYDFNHESQATQDLVDSISSFWMNEYKVDGFRFDFTKGFSNTIYGISSWGSDYDKDRIENLKRMADEIWKRKSDALLILEHLAVNTEEKELADYGFLLWGNMHGNYLEAARGNTGSSDLSWAMYDKRGWNSPNLVSYPESHDEERIMVDLKNTGLSNGAYNIKNEQTALERIELNALFHILLPGPKMIWQFGERGYDHSINAFGGRLSEKPPFWDYVNNTNRADLINVYAALNKLKQTYDEFSPDNMEYSLTGSIKSYKFTKNNNHVVAIGNFGISENNATLVFPKTGKWFEFFSNDSLEITSVVQNYTLAPGEYRLFTTRKMSRTNTTTASMELNHGSERVQIFPNPAIRQIQINATEPITDIKIYSVSGKIMYQNNAVPEKFQKINLDNFKPGIYLVQVFVLNKSITQKIVIR